MAVAISNGTLRMDGGKPEEGRSRRLGSSVPRPTNPMVSPLLNDLYQFTMAYAYWKAGKQDERAVFDLFFRKNPFGGEYTIFGGLEECIRYIANFKFEEEEVSFLRSAMPTCEDAFFDYLKAIDCSDVEVYAIPEGSVVFPKIPLMRVEGPVAVVQLLETPFVNLVNYASLVTTNAARHRFVAGKSKLLLEFGLRRAQGPDGGVSASKYSYMGGFDATSNVAAGRLFGIPLRGTHSHAFVSSFLAVIKMNEHGSFYLKNIGKCSILINGKAILSGMQLNITSWCLIEGGGGGPVTITAPASGGGGAAAAPAPVEEKKEEPKEESDDDMGFSLFD